MCIKIYNGMFNLTASERKAIVFILSIVLIGACLHVLLRNHTFNTFFYRDMISRIDTSPATISIPIDPNTATVEKLSQIPGIGPVLAERIIRYRGQHGAFTKEEDLGAVKGIGARKLQRIKKFLIFP